VVGARNWITPPDELEDAFFPQVADMLDAVHTYILPLKGYEAKRACAPSEKARREKQGV
jgi:2-oxoisovalerate dehydrogenase E1 component